jgi:hypothetical protein
MENRIHNFLTTAMYARIQDAIDAYEIPIEDEFETYANLQEAKDCREKLKKRFTLSQEIKHCIAAFYEHMKDEVISTRFTTQESNEEIIAHLRKCNTEKFAAFVLEHGLKFMQEHRGESSELMRFTTKGDIEQSISKSAKKVKLSTEIDAKVQSGFIGFLKKIAWHLGGRCAHSKRKVTFYVEDIYSLLADFGITLDDLKLIRDDEMQSVLEEINNKRAERQAKKEDSSRASEGQGDVKPAAGKKAPAKKAPAKNAKAPVKSAPKSAAKKAPAKNATKAATSRAKSAGTKSARSRKGKEIVDDEATENTEDTGEIAEETVDEHTDENANETADEAADAGEADEDEPEEDEEPEEEDADEDAGEDEDTDE